MWISCAACSWIALTTSGWQWPVEQTATPALQSKKMLPSTSSTQTPLARSATSLKEGRGYEGVTNFASASTIFLPFGPGSAVLISGRLGVASTVLDMFSLLEERTIKCGWEVCYESTRKTSRRRGSRVTRAGDNVIAGRASDLDSSTAS